MDRNLAGVKVALVAAIAEWNAIRVWRFSGATTIHDAVVRRGRG